MNYNLISSSVYPVTLYLLNFSMFYSYFFCVYKKLERGLATNDDISKFNLFIQMCHPFQAITKFIILRIHLYRLYNLILKHVMHESSLSLLLSSSMRSNIKLFQ